MKKLPIIILLCVFCNVSLKAGDSLRFPIIISVFNNATVLPGTGKLGFINTPVHPGICIGSVIKEYRSNEKSDVFQTIKLGYYYHKYFQNSIQLYTELGYRYKFNFGLDLEAELGVGYLLAIQDIEVFELNKHGTYDNKSSARSQIMAGFGIAPSTVIFKETDHPVRLFINYQFYLQMPFVKSYVPVLPNTAIHLGAIFNINKKVK